MRASVLVRLPDGSTSRLGPGDLVGRSWRASLLIEDPRVSEAHALVSLRGDRLRLMALRGRFQVDGRLLSELDLAPGLRVALAPGAWFDVLDVVLPETVAALSGDGLAETALHGPAALVFRPEPQLVPAAAEDAAAWIWPGPEGFRLRLGEGGARPLRVGEPFEVRGRRFQLGTITLRPSQPTQASAAPAPLLLVARYETVHIHRPDRLPLVLDGVQARLVSELIAFGVPVAWTVLARELWPDLEDAQLLRKRLDGALARIRARLAEAGVRTDLVRNNGQGQFELLLEPDDRVEDCG